MPILSHHPQSCVTAQHGSVSSGCAAHVASDLKTGRLRGYKRRIDFLTDNKEAHVLHQGNASLLHELVIYGPAN